MSMSVRTPSPARSGRAEPAGQASVGPQAKPGDLPLPHERDEAVGEVAAAPDPVIQQAKRDLDAGMVDTDMRATPGLDAAQRERLVKRASPRARQPGQPNPAPDAPEAPERQGGEDPPEEDPDPERHQPGRE